MTPMKSFRRLALLPAVLTCYLPLPAAAEIGVEHSGEVTLEASWYPETAAHAGQRYSFAYLEAKPELVIYGDEAEMLLQPRISGGTSGGG